MTPIQFRNVSIRDYCDEDYESVINLNLKQGDKDELYRMASLEPKEYLVWHIGYHGSNTKVVLLDGIIVGILGVSDGIIYFTTSDIPKGASINFVRCFKWAIRAIMEDAGIKSILTYVDALYESAVNWDKLCGFKMVSEVEINGNTFYCMKYKLP